MGVSATRKGDGEEWGGGGRRKSGIAEEKRKFSWLLLERRDIRTCNSDSSYPPLVISLVAIRQNLFTSGRISRIATPTLTKKPRTLKREDTKGEGKSPFHSSIGLLFVYCTSLFRRGRSPSKNSSMIFERSFRNVSFSFSLLLLLSWLDTILKRR